MPYDSELEYRHRQAEIVRKAWQSGVYDAIRKREVRSCKNPLCNNSFQVRPSDKKIYCCGSCRATVTNRFRRKDRPLCLVCAHPTSRSGYKYCSNRCQIDYQYLQFINKWKNGEADGNKGIYAKVLSSHLRRYLLKKYQYQCSVCRWSKKHPITNMVPLEVDHIDGNADNNKEENLRLLCPNCHSLTPNFRNLNKGKGRAWRILYS